MRVGGGEGGGSGFRVVNFDVLRASSHFTPVNGKQPLTPITLEPDELVLEVDIEVARGDEKRTESVVVDSEFSNRVETHYQTKTNDRTSDEAKRIFFLLDFIVVIRCLPPQKTSSSVRASLTSKERNPQRPSYSSKKHP